MDSEKALKAWDLVDEQNKLLDDHCSAEVVRKGKCISITFEHGIYLTEIISRIDALIDTIFDEHKIILQEKLEKL